VGVFAYGKPNSLPIYFIFPQGALRAQNVGFPDPRKVTVLALIPLSLGTFLGLLASHYWRKGGLQGEDYTQDKTSFQKVKLVVVWLALVT
jgi:hypothetical protein